MTSASLEEAEKMAGVHLVFGRIFLLFFFILDQSLCRIHNITLQNEERHSVKISTFGILEHGYIHINVENLTVIANPTFKFGFSVQRTGSAGMSAYVEGHTEECLLEKNSTDNMAFDLFIFKWKSKQIVVRKCGEMNAAITRNWSVNDAEDNQKTNTESKKSYCPFVTQLPLIVHNLHNKTSMSGNIVIHVENRTEKGLYNIYFHHCKDNDDKSVIDLKVDVIEVNDGNFLSAGEAPLPMVLGFFSVVFFILSCIWFYILRQYWEETFKVHYLMFLLVLLKALDVSLNAINYYYIGKDGKKAESWAVLHYIAHLLKGGLLFTTIILLGTGYFFIKHVLSGRDKKIFLIVIPLQIFDNIALIIMESTEESEADYVTWKQMFLLVDLVCCGAVLFPVIWAIRHLKEASTTDGKAAMNLAKLKLFRQFYIMIVCYIYFTRIIVAIVKITVPFQYQWLEEFFMNLATLALFVMTGYKFRPGSDNPYLSVPQEDEDIEMDDVVTQSGLTENVTRVQANSNGNAPPTTRVKMSAA